MSEQRDGHFQEIVDRMMGTSRLHQSIVEDVPQLKRGRVWCHHCGRTQPVDSGYCLAHGWPTCCGATMSIDSPAERKQRTKAVQR